jgi:hypothetical protein
MSQQDVLSVLQKLHKVRIAHVCWCRGTNFQAALIPKAKVTNWSTQNLQWHVEVLTSLSPQTSGLTLKHANNTEFRTEGLGAKWPNLAQQQSCVYGPTQPPCSIPNREVAARSIRWFSSGGGRHHRVGCRLRVFSPSTNSSQLNDRWNVNFVK